MARLQQFSPGPVIQLHFQSMRAPRKDGLAIIDKLVLFGLPAALGAGAGTAVGLGLQLHDGVSQVLAGTALLVGAMLSLFVFLTNLRIKVSEAPTYAFRSNLQKLIGGCAVGCLYVAGVSLVSAALLSAVATLEPLRAGVPRLVMAGVLVSVLAHLAINLLSVIRRLFGVYVDIFAADFSPDLDEDPPRGSDIPERENRGRRLPGSQRVI